MNDHRHFGIVCSLARELYPAHQRFVVVNVLQEVLDAHLPQRAPPVSRLSLFDGQIERCFAFLIGIMPLGAEVEQRLQIRRLQHATAEYLINNPGTITQLNMGEGKTRVILPMIILQMATPERLLRLHVLSQLLSEGYEYLHLHLTASVMLRRLCLMPFQRDIHLDLDGVDKMLKVLMRCQASRGVLVVAPEHRLSLQLKFLELRLAALHPESPSSAATQLVATLPKLDELPYSDWLDESDEILRHKYQLIYAIGACEALPAGPQRWTVVQALTKQLMVNKAVNEVLLREGVVKRLHWGRHAGSFDDIRLLPGVALDAARQDLTQSLCRAILADPPYQCVGC